MDRLQRRREDYRRKLSQLYTRLNAQRASRKRGAAPIAAQPDGLCSDGELSLIFTLPSPLKERAFVDMVMREASEYSHRERLESELKRVRA